MSGMKTYLIPVTHTATVVVDHKIEAKNMQDAMFRLGKSISDAADPFACVEPDGEMGVAVTAGSPQIIADDETLDLTTDAKALAEAEAS